MAAISVYAVTSPLGRPRVIATSAVSVALICLNAWLGVSARPAVAQNEKQTAQVLSVVDGDVIDVLVEGIRERVRYIGVDAPETKHPSRPVQCFGPEAAAKNAELLSDGLVELEKDTTDRDRYGRLLRYVWIGESMVNAALVADGYAQVANYEPDLKYSVQLLELQAAARQAGRGLWTACPGLEPPPAKLQPVADDPPVEPEPVDVRTVSLIATDFPGYARDDRESRYEERSDGFVRNLVVFLPQARRIGEPVFYNVVDRYADNGAAEEALRSLRGASFQIRGLRMYPDDQNWSEVSAPPLGHQSRAFRAKGSRLILVSDPSNIFGPGSTVIDLNAAWLWARRANVLFGVAMDGADHLVSIDALAPRVNLVDARVKDALQ